MIKAKPYEDPKHSYTPKVYKPHQQRFTIPLCSITSQSETDLLIIESKIHTNNRPINLMVDSGATKDFISKSFVNTNNLIVESLDTPLRVSLADGRQVIARQATTLQFWLGDQLVSRQFVVTELQKEFDAILGTPFLKEYNPNIDWNLGIISMPNSQVKLSAIVQSRTADVEIISAKKMAKQINVYLCRCSPGNNSI